MSTFSDYQVGLEDRRPRGLRPRHHLGHRWLGRREHLELSRIANRSGSPQTMLLLEDRFSGIVGNDTLTDWLRSTPISSKTCSTTSSPSSSMPTSMASSMASSIISCLSSMTAVSRSNSMAIRCNAGRFIDRFMLPRATVAPFMACIICSFVRWV